ncbi:MAG: type II secretion system secretin GspD [Asticcacaulis sp.]|uniref:type II secretion system secretin GspD n=1 Tax=Asticcacaulis sp. TaxID=1872648 RepID=UPI003F7CC6FC
MSVSLLSAPLALGAAIPASAYAATGQQTYIFAFKDADISQVAQEILGNSLGVAYRVEPGVTGKMTFTIEQRLTRAQLLAAFETALAQYDVVMTHDGDTVVLQSRKTAAVGGQITTGASRPSGVGYQVRAVPINYGSASEIAKALGTVSDSNLVLFSSDKLNLIILGGRSEELDNALTTIALFDKSTLADSRIRFFNLSNASAEDVADDLGSILKASGTSSVAIAPMKRLNGIFAFSQSSQALDQVGEFIRRLDVPSQDMATKVFVYHPKGASAESLAATLSAVAGISSGANEPSASPVDSSSTTNGQAAGSRLAAASAQGSQPMSANGQNIRVVADKDTNSVIIDAPDAVLVHLQQVLQDIDREPAQIFIEASIVEVTLNKDLNYGIDWSKLASHGDLTVSNYSSNSTSFSPIAPGFSATYVGSDISAALTALSSQSKVKIVSAPKITTIENSPATLQVGDQVPVVVQSAQSTTTSTAPLVNSVDYRDTGVLLKVTPRITNGNRILLDISQEVSSVAKTVTSGIDSPTINQRKLASSLIVPEGAVVALGGLISSSDSTSDNGVPGLKSIPLIGGLFKGQTNSGQRTELIILLKARIMRDQSDYTALTSNLSADLRDLMRSGFIDVSANHATP